MYRYIKSNGSVSKVSKNMLISIELLLNDSTVESTEEIELSVDSDMKDFVYDYLDNICESVSNYLVNNYPVFTGTYKPNHNYSSMYLPVALLDDSFPGKLRVELMAFANISRISDHSQTNESDDIKEAREDTTNQFKQEMKTRLYNESIVNKSKDSKSELARKESMVEDYTFPEDFSIHLIFPEERSEESISSEEMLIQRIGDKIYENLLDINDLND